MKFAAEASTAVTHVLMSAAHPKKVAKRTVCIIFYNVFEMPLEVPPQPLSGGACANRAWTGNRSKCVNDIWRCRIKPLCLYCKFDWLGLPAHMLCSCVCGLKHSFCARRYRYQRHCFVLSFGDERLGICKSLMRPVASEAMH